MLSLPVSAASPRTLQLGAPPKAALQAYFAGAVAPSGRPNAAVVLDALDHLAALVATGADPFQVWALRAVLAARFATPAAPWWWPFDHLPDADRGWLADIAIWERCRAGVPAAAAFDAVVHTTRSPHLLRRFALARATRIAEGRDHTALDGALLSAFTDNTPTPIFQPRRSFWKGGSRDPIPVGRLGPNARRMAGSLLATRGASSGETLLQAFVGWLGGAHAGDPRAFETLAHLWQRGVPSARAALAEIASGPNPWPPITRQRALRLLLIPRPTLQPLESP